MGVCLNTREQPEQPQVSFTFFFSFSCFEMWSLPGLELAKLSKVDAEQTQGLACLFASQLLDYKDVLCLPVCIWALDMKLKSSCLQGK